MCYSNHMRRRRDYLIPLENTRRVIRLDKRGKRDKKSLLRAVFAILGILCMLYFLLILFFMGYGSHFFVIWAFLAAGFGGLFLLYSTPVLLERIPGWLKRLAWSCIALLCGVFVLVEGFIFTGFGEKASPGAEYMIILGAQWKTSGPSYILQKRLDKALEYLAENPQTIVIVSGGQGSNEVISEAEGMKSYLEEAGIAQDRIIMEDRSTDTSENLKYSMKFISSPDSRVVVVTNNFHVFRSVQIARKTGYLSVEGLAADSYPLMLPNNLLREFCGVTKDFFVKNM